VHTLPECDDPKDGNAVAGATPFGPGADIVAGVVLPADRASSTQTCLLLATRAGMLKKTSLEALPGHSARTFTAINLGAEDELGWARLTGGQDNLLLVSRGGAGILFSEEEIRPTGLGAGGVLGIRLEAGDAVAGIDAVPGKSEVLLVSERGQVKRVDVGQFPLQRRNGKGVRAWKLEGEDALAAGGIGTADDRAVIHLQKSPDRSIAFSDAPRRTRAGRGKQLIEVRENDRVLSLTVPQARAAPGEKAAPASEKKTARPTSARKTKSPKKGSAARKAKTNASRAKAAGKSKPAADRGGKPKPARAKGATRKTATKGKR
jgi:DNA gyrase subunit A